jgi:hypothetical protein
VLVLLSLFLGVQLSPITTMLLIAAGVLALLLVVVLIIRAYQARGFIEAWHRQFPAGALLYLTPEHLRLAGTETESHFRWSVLEEVAVDRDHLYVLVTKRAAIILPLRCFEDPERAPEVVAYVKERLETAGGQPATPATGEKRDD